MEISAALEYVSKNDHAVLATRARDGTPQMSPVTLAVVNDTVVMSTRDTAFKVKNLHRDPQCWLCVFPDKWLGRWVQLECRAEILSGEAALDPLQDYYRTLRGEHPDWDDYRQAMVEEKRCLVRFQITKAGPDQHG